MDINLILGICLLLGISIVWYLLVEGGLWKIIIGIAGWFGLHIGMQLYFPSSINECLSYKGHSFSWSEVIPTFILLMAMLYTKEN